MKFFVSDMEMILHFEQSAIFLAHEVAKRRPKFARFTVSVGFERRLTSMAGTDCTRGASRTDEVNPKLLPI